jgi:hypothetical protein
MLPLGVQPNQSAPGNHVVRRPCEAIECVACMVRVVALPREIETAITVMECDREKRSPSGSCSNLCANSTFLAGMSAFVVAIGVLADMGGAVGSVDSDPSRHFADIN